ncbi:ATP-sensitive inward rectifier potassium channel 1 [Tetrabaena socialis]|uniref:ATP-sensitive inward rectifier potassium channel 1 n=1 Tax=Tetrabaena socialis TaxID=47790 RepID=A0A2J8ACR2_9CHLO|nr:ATP-sensitive inward rectifier potassium channel 1 [Tetrabaena socialis]|eukprot:PNH10296.1 ATP-sensitive inward rectifier potassium channel 1 [Tetrabaena socialis]
MTFPYDLFKRGWRRADDYESSSTPLPIISSTDHDGASGSGSGRRSTRDGEYDYYGTSGKRFRLLDKRRAAKGIRRLGLPAGGYYLYWTDIFHTLLNMPRYRFLIVFFAVYLSEYVVFALLYLTQPDRCVGGTMKFSHALWFSVQTAATLGYTGSLQPNIDCTSVNMLVIVQVITASLIDYCMMGLVFARFASPNKRSFTIRFSSSAVLFQRNEDGLWCLSFRLANIRKHSLINPQASAVSLMLALPADNRGGGSASPAAAAAATNPAGPATSYAHFRFSELCIEDVGSQAANLRLGLHAHVNHIIRPGSPLYDRSLDALEALGAEVLCFMEGVDPMTSNNIQARHSYTPGDIRMNERFVPIDLKLRRGELGLDFSGFDATTARALATGGADEVREGGFATFLMPVPGPAPGPAPGSGSGFPIPEHHGHGDVEAGWAGAGAASSSAAGIPLGRLHVGGGGGGGEVDSVMAAALSGDMRSHMRALRSQSIRSLTTPLSSVPQLVPSVPGPSPRGGGAAAAYPQPAPYPRPHPLALPGGIGGSPFAAALTTAAAAAPVSPAHHHQLGSYQGGGTGGAAAAAAWPSGALELRDLFDAVLTDVGCSGAVKRQAAALKEALGAAELVPRGPAELAGRQL